MVVVVSSKTRKNESNGSDTMIITIINNMTYFWKKICHISACCVNVIELDVGYNELRKGGE
jgi:hypothetical protein